MPFPGGSTFPGATTFPGAGTASEPALTTATGPQWTIYVRDNRDLTRVAQIDDYQSLEIIPRFNDVGTWVLRVHSSVFRRINLDVWNLGIEIVRRVTPTDVGTTVLSGPASGERRERTNDTDISTISGFDDNVWLTSRLASPQPGNATPPYNTAAHDIHSGTASSVIRDFVSVNAGAGATTARVVPGLVIAADPFIGSAVTGRARWNNLLEFIQGLAISGGGLGFHINQSDTTLSFVVYQPTDKSSSIHFSPGLGNLSAYTYEVVRPEADYVYVAGGGEGTARIIREGSNGNEQTRWGRVEQFRDRRDTTDLAELDQSATEHLAENGEKTSLSITPVDLPGQTYGVHYHLGDKVSVVIDDAVIVDVVREVKITLTPDGPQTISPVIGTAGKHDVVKLFRSMRDMKQRILNLERR